MAGEDGSDATALRNNQMSAGKICAANQTPPKCKASSSYCMFGSCISVPDCGSGRVVSPLLLTERGSAAAPLPACAAVTAEGFLTWWRRAKPRSLRQSGLHRTQSHTEFGLSPALLITQQVTFRPKPSKNPPSLRTTDASVAQT